MYKISILIFIVFFSSCKNNIPEKCVLKNVSQVINDKNENSYAFVKDIPLPQGYERIHNENNSFEEWLENVPLKNDKTVYLFDGSPKSNQKAQYAVLNVSVGTKNLQQCADAVMRLRAEYLFTNRRFEEIQFKDNSSRMYNFEPPYTKQHFKEYLDVVFGMCGSASLAKQLKTVQVFSDIKGGDVLIRGGFPGHAVIVVDVAVNRNGTKIYMLAQSYMPAQDIHILINPSNNDLSPWYEADGGIEVNTPEYNFRRSELKTW